MVVQLSNLLNQYGWAQVEYMNSASFVTEINHEVARVNYIMASFIFVLELLKLFISFLFLSTFFKETCCPLLGGPKNVQFDMAMAKKVMRYDMLLKVENEKLEKEV